MRLFAVLAACAAISLPALAQAAESTDVPAAAQPSAQAPAPTKPAKPKRDVICKALPSTETRLGGPRECHSKAEWDELARNAHDQSTHRGSASGSH